MKINGWTVDADYLIGRRFRWTTKTEDGRDIPDVTFVSYKVVAHVELIRAHALDGGKQWLKLREVQNTIRYQILVESETGAPFTVK